MVCVLSESKTVTLRRTSRVNLDLNFSGLFQRHEQCKMNLHKHGLHCLRRLSNSSRILSNISKPPNISNDNEAES